MDRRAVSREGIDLTRRSYTLRAERPLALKVAGWFAACALSAAVGGLAVSAVIAKHTPRDGAQATPCRPEPVDTAPIEQELARARLALAQESAARAAVQKSADDASAEAARLNAELQFLRGQSRTAPARR